MSKNIAFAYAKNDYLFLPLTNIKKDIFYNAAKYKNLSYIPIFDNVLIFKKQSKILPINFINYFIEQKNPILRIKEKDVYSLISQETFNIQVINLDEIKITFDKSSIDYYNLLIVLKNMCNLEFTTNDFLFQLIYEEFVNENKLNDLWKCYKVNLLEWQKLSFETN